MAFVIEGTLVLPDGPVEGQLEVNDGTIVSVALTRARFVTPDVKVPPGLLISPGFIDIQINGAFGKEFKTDIDALDVVTAGLPRFGTTAICPTITTRELTSYEEHMNGLKANRKGSSGAKLLGFHLEGPFLNPKKAGAHKAGLLTTPGGSQYAGYATGDVAIVTLAPELEGAPALVARLIRDGKKVGFGHSQASYEEVLSVFDPANTMVVHVFNAMDGLQARSPGLAGAALEHDACYTTLITDGIHVDPALVRIVWKCKQDKRRLICITDSSAVAGLPIGPHQIGERRIERLTDRAVLAGTATLVGSVLTQDASARNLRHFTSCSLEEAVNAVSLNPATFLGRADTVGQIRAGCAADLVIHDEDFVVQQTYVDGQCVFTRRD